MMLWQQWRLSQTHSTPDDRKLQEIVIGMLSHLGLNAFVKQATVLKWQLFIHRNRNKNVIFRKIFGHWQHS